MNGSTKRTLAAATLLALMGQGLQIPTRAGAQEQTIRAEVALVNLFFAAVDAKNRFVPNLKAEDFLVFEERQPQKIDYFSDLSKENDVPLTMALLIDTSGSVKDKLEYEKRTAEEFFRSVLRKGKDLACIIQFDSEVNLVQDFTDDIRKLVSALDTLEAGNSTALYDAVYLAVDEKLKGETGRKAIVVITDGEDTSSKIRKNEAIETAQTDFGVLRKFAEETGGSFFSPRAKLAEIQAAFRSINEDLQGQYSLAYVSTNKRRDGAFRTVEIRCKATGVRVRTRKGYYAPKG